MTEFPGRSFSKINLVIQKGSIVSLAEVALIGEDMPGRFIISYSKTTSKLTNVYSKLNFIHSQI